MARRAAKKKTLTLVHGLAKHSSSPWLSLVLNLNPDLGSVMPTDG